MKDILKKLRGTKGVTAEAFANDIGIPVRTYTNYESGAAQPKYDTLIRIADYYGVSTDYLLGRTDKPASSDLSDILKEMQLDASTRAIICAFAELGEDQRTEFIKTLKQLSHSEPEIRETAVRWFEKLSVHKVSAGAGYDLTDGDLWQRARLVDCPELDSADFAVEVDGDSMEPTISDGEIVLVKAGAEVEEGEIGLFIYDGSGYVKERGAEGLISHNPDYAPIIPTSDVVCVGKVIGKTRKV